MNSKEATRFRIWSRGILKQYMRKGYVLNKELLINGGRFSDEYFEQLLEEIRDIRSSERKVYHKITDLYATAYDYNKDAEITRNFYAKVQNKLHYAVSGERELMNLSNQNMKNSNQFRISYLNPIMKNSIRNQESCWTTLKNNN